jgi:hypothetical protein
MSAAKDPAQGERKPAGDRKNTDKARLDAIFGEVLPDTTSDERDAGSPEDGGADAWLRSQVPPHHG